MTVTPGEPTQVTPKRDVVTLSMFGIGGMVLVVLLATQAFDVLLLLVICGITFLLERTAGDWLADLFGPLGSKVVFIGGLIIAGFVMLSIGSVRDIMWRGLADADEAGFHSVLIEHLSEMPAAEPISGDGVATGSTGGAPRSAAPHPGGGAPQAERSKQDGPPAVSTRSVLRLGGQGESVHFAVDVIASGITVDEGTVEFSIDGRRVTNARVIAGRAAARVSGVSRGSHRASAKYIGTSRFRESVAESAFSR